MAAVDIAELTEDSWRLSPDTFAEHFDPEWHAFNHHRVIARAVRRAIAKSRGRLLVEIPPQHGKSTLVSRYAPSWYLSLNPLGRVILVSYAANYAAEWGRAVRNTIEEHAPELGVSVARDSSAADRWRTTAGGGMWTAGLDGQVTGRGADVLILDDLIKNYQAAHSPTGRQQIKDLYTTVLRPRLAPTGSVIVPMTRWHVDDPIGWLLDLEEQGGDHWEVVRLPAIAEEHEAWDLGNGEVWEREEGDALWPEQYDAESLEATRTSGMSRYQFVALYQQRPSPPEGAIVNRDWWMRWTHLPDRCDEWLLSVDTTFKDSDGTDYVTIGAWARKGGSFYLVDMIRARMNYPAFKAALVDFAAKWPQCRRKLIEDKANGPAVIAELKQSMSGLVPRNPRDSKLGRAHAVSGLIEARNVYLPASDGHWYPGESLDGPAPHKAPWVLDFIEEWAEFTGDDKGHDDQVDMTTQALIEFTIGKRPGVKSKTAAGRNHGGQTPRVPAGAGGLGGVSGR
jgi:predicted phage terminase large subunit-like protein